MRLTDFTTLTFDCYGTLIDWESGIYAALQPLLARAGVASSRDAVLAVFATEDARTGMSSFLANGPGKAAFEGR